MWSTVPSSDVPTTLFRGLQNWWSYSNAYFSTYIDLLGVAQLFVIGGDQAYASVHGTDGHIAFAQSHWEDAVVDASDAKLCLAFANFLGIIDKDLTWSQAILDPQPNYALVDNNGTLHLSQQRQTFKPTWPKRQDLE